jgi:hypothetical protein
MPEISQHSIDLFQILLWLLVFVTIVASQTAATQLLSSAPYMRGNITAISGDGATVTLNSGE